LTRRDTGTPHVLPEECAKDANSLALLGGHDETDRQSQGYSAGIASGPCTPTEEIRQQEALAPSYSPLQTVIYATRSMVSLDDINHPTLLMMARSGD
jgi:hypothetical protein